MKLISRCAALGVAGAAAVAGADIPDIAATEQAPASAVTSAVPATATAAGGDARQPFSYYEVILSRRPFGVAPAAAAVAAADDGAAAAATQVQAAMAKQLRLCAVMNTDQGIAAGFVDNSQKPPKSFLLHIGESAESYKLLSADVAKEVAEVEKDGVALSFNLSGAMMPGEGGAQSSGVREAPRIPSLAAHSTAVSDRSPAFHTPALRTIASTPAVASPPRPASSPESWPVPRNLKAIDRALQLGIRETSYLERLKRRREELLAEQQKREGEQASAATQAMEDRAAEVFTAMLRRKNMEMIRHGEGSLGIPLTPEEDAQLVEEGVLPKP